MWLCNRVQDCFAENVCSDEIRSLAQTIANDCVLAKACKGSKPTDVKFCNVQPLVTNNNVADVTLYVRTHNPYSSSNSEGAYVPTYAEPPVSATDAEWVSSPNVKVGPHSVFVLTSPVALAFVDVP